MKDTQIPGSLFPNRDSIKNIIGIILSLIIYFIFCCLSTPGWASLGFRHDFMIVPVLLVLSFIFAFRFRGSYQIPTGLAITYIFCGVILHGLWQAGISDGSIIGGLLPFSDACGYMDGAKQLLSGERLTHFTSRRPLFPSFLATIFYFSNLNLQTTLIILSLITSTCCYFASYAVYRTHGPITAAIFLTFEMLFYRRFIGTTLTEHLGLALGCLSFASMWRGVYEKNQNLVWIGLVFLTLALNARAGAFFILITITGWIIYTHCKDSFRKLIAFFIVSVSLIASVFVLNYCLLSSIGSPSSGFSNFSYTLYGLATGGNWTQVFNDHPEIRTIQEPEASMMTYRLAMDIIKDKPLSLVWGSMRAWRDYLFLSGNMMSFVSTYYLEGAGVPLSQVFFDNPFAFLNRVFYRGIVFIFLLLTFFQLYNSARGIKENNNSFLLFIFAGVFASVPFAPPWDANSMRAYAATLPFTMVIHALGFSTFVSWFFKKNMVSSLSNQVIKTRYYFITLLVSLFLLFAGPLLVKGRVIPNQRPDLPDGNMASVFVYPGSYLKLTRTLPDSLESASVIQTDMFRKWLDVDFAKAYSVTADYLRNLDNVYLFFPEKTVDNRCVMLLADPAVIGNKKGFHWVKITEEHNSVLRVYRIDAVLD